MAIKTLKTGEIIEIIPAIDVSQQSLARFYSLAYPERANFLINHWKWLYSGRNSQNIQCWPIVARAQNGTIVAHAATIPTHVIIDNELLDARWFVDYFVSEQFRGMGLASILIDEVMDSAEIVAIIGSSSAAKPVFRHHGWSECFGTISYSLPLKISNNVRFRSAPFQRLLRITDILLNRYYRIRKGVVTNDFELLPLTSRNLQRFTDNALDFPVGVAQLHDNTFLTRRLIDFPLSHQIRVYSSTHSTALIRFTKSGGYSRMNILKIMTTAPIQFFKHILALGLEHCVDEIALVSSDKVLQDSFNRLFPIRKNIPFYLFSRTRTLPSSTSMKSVRWEMIDSDLDLVHTSC